MEKINTVDEYINNYDGIVKDRLMEIRNIIKSNSNDLKEIISWGMPTYKLNGNLIHFAAHKHHIGIYPGPSAIIEFKEELKEYSTSKGAIQIPFDKDIPEDLIIKILKFRIKEQS